MRLIPAEGRTGRIDQPVSVVLDLEDCNTLACVVRVGDDQREMQFSIHDLITEDLLNPYKDRVTGRVEDEEGRFFAQEILKGLRVITCMIEAHLG
jgi:hypothetical protein